MNFNGNGITNASNANDNSGIENTNQSNTNPTGNKTSFLIDDILFPSKLRTDSTRQVKIQLYNRLRKFTVLTYIREQEHVQLSISKFDLDLYFDSSGCTVECK